MSKYRIITALNEEGELVYKIQERKLYFFWDTTMYRHVSLLVVRRWVQELIELDKEQEARAAFKSKVIE